MVSNPNINMIRTIKYKAGEIIRQKNAHVYILHFIFCLLISCAPSIKELSETDPEAVINRKNELLAGSSVSKEVKTAVINAHNKIGNEALRREDLEEAEKQFNESLLLDNKNKQAHYGLAMIKGLRRFKKGSKSALWEAMENFGKAAFFDPAKGDPHYWMGRTYEKKDDGDFDLIIEAYEKALGLPLPDPLKQDAQNRLELVKKHQKTLEDFWN